MAAVRSMLSFLLFRMRLMFSATAPIQLHMPFTPAKKANILTNCTPILPELADIVKKKAERLKAAPLVEFYTRFQVAPPLVSMISMPRALSSSRMRSASAKFFAFLAS